MLLLAFAFTIFFVWTGPYSILSWVYADGSQIPKRNLLCDLSNTRSDALMSSAIYGRYDWPNQVHYIPDKARALRHARALLSFYARRQRHQRAQAQMLRHEEK